MLPLRSLPRRCKRFTDTKDGVGKGRFSERRDSLSFFIFTSILLLLPPSFPLSPSLHSTPPFLSPSLIQFFAFSFPPSPLSLSPSFPLSFSPSLILSLSTFLRHSFPLSLPPSSPSLPHSFPPSFTSSLLLTPSLPPSLPPFHSLSTSLPPHIPPSSQIPSLTPSLFPSLPLSLPLTLSLSSLNRPLSAVLLPLRLWSWKQW